VARFIVEYLRLFLPFLPDELCWCEALEGLEPSGVVVTVDEQIKVSAQLVVVLIEIAFDGGFLDRPVHALDLAIRARMVGFGQAVFDLVGVADHVEAMHAELGGPAIAVSRLVGELDVIGQYEVDLVGNRLQHGLKEGHGGGSVRLFIEPDDGKFRCAINCYEHVELALTAAHFSDVDVEEADRISLDFLLCGRVAVHVGQPGYAVTL
jgi:hypothetical protein